MGGGQQGRGNHNLNSRMIQVYKQLMANKPELEELVWKVQEGWGEGSEGAPAQQSISPVNKYIHQAGLSSQQFQQVKLHKH